VNILWISEQIQTPQMEAAGCRWIEDQTLLPSMGVYRIQRRTNVPVKSRQTILIDSLLREILPPLDVRLSLYTTAGPERRSGLSSRWRRS
jgi:hypothetical protein